MNEKAAVFCCGVLVAFVGYVVLNWALEDEDRFPFVVLTLIPALVAIGLMSEIFTFLKIMIAPRIYLIEYAADLVK